jgi:hypothetical protein
VAVHEGLRAAGAAQLPASGFLVVLGTLRRRLAAAVKLPLERWAELDTSAGSGGGIPGAHPDRVSAVVGLGWNWGWRWWRPPSIRTPCCVLRDDPGGFGSGI